jgi:hypothetical protein
MGATGDVDPASGLQTGSLRVVLGQRPVLATDKSHYFDLDAITFDAIGFANLPAFVMFGASLSGQSDFAISFATPWLIVPCSATDAFGGLALAGQLPDFQGVPLTFYAQAYFPYAGAKRHTLFSEVATISMN